jgi:diacylglycerol kinase family enzyme
VCDGKNELRFYLCGGDGTFNEGVNGAVGFDNVSVGIIPVGTGNDFVRNFKNKENFFNIFSQLDGEKMAIDLISYGERYCANMMNVGFDCQAAIYASEMKKKAFVPAKLAYVAGVLKALIKMPGVRATVHCEGEKAAEKDCILVCVANGMFCVVAPLAYPSPFTDTSYFTRILSKISRSGDLLFSGNGMRSLMFLVLRCAHLQEIAL